MGATPQKIPGTCHDWTAVHDFMPPTPGRLRVHGKCTFPTSGYSVELKKHVPQGINPAILLLDKVVTPPAGIVSQKVTTVDVSYHEVTDIHYLEVEILPDGTKIQIKEVF